jgi:hypothetical protein
MRVAGFAFLVTLATAIIAGAIPGLRLARVDVLPWLQRGHRSARGRRVAGGRTLLAAEAALGALLVLGAMLAGRSFLQLTGDDLGFQADGLYSAFVTSPRQSVQIEELLATAERLPGVTRAAAGDWVSVGAEAPMMGFEVAGTQCAIVQVSRGYFETLEAPLIAGRFFSRQELATRADVAIVNRSAARLIWPNISPADVIGQVWQSAQRPRVIVGLVSDMKEGYGSTEDQAAVFVPAEADNPRLLTLILRALPGQIIRLQDLRTAFGSDANGQPAVLRSQRDFLNRDLQDPRFRAGLLSTFALTGLLLAAVGLFAVASYDAAARDYEMGVRLALGARPGALKRLILRDACVPVAAGTFAGLGAAWWMSGAAQAFLFQTDAGEPAYYLIVAGVLVATAAIAAWVPACRAARTNPVVLLKAQ